jgi:NosR/NirI family transcriptional regulator, nitrous oxide reductase regulator
MLDGVAKATTSTRARGQMLPVFTHRQAALSYKPPPYLFAYPPKPIPEWLAAWKGRWTELAVIAFSLAILTAALARPRWLAAAPGRLRAFRLAFLAYTLVFLGRHAQGQLSVVQVTGALKSLSFGGGLASYLYDPVSLLLIGFTFVSFAIWGRGTFCGWLCPFGALQEFVGLIAEKLRLPQIRLLAKLARPMGHMRSVILAALAAAAVLTPTLGECLNAVEPFKTSITLGFNASWPFVFPMPRLRRHLSRRRSLRACRAFRKKKEEIGRQEQSLGGVVVPPQSSGPLVSVALSGPHGAAVSII